MNNYSVFAFCAIKLDFSSVFTFFIQDSSQHNNNNSCAESYPRGLFSDDLSLKCNIPIQLDTN